MAKIRIYRHPACARCRRIAQIHKLLDWEDRVEVSVSEPRGLPLAMGEVRVEDLGTGDMLEGFDAFAAICRVIPAYGPLRALFVFPSFRSYAARRMSAGRIKDA